MFCVCIGDTGKYQLKLSTSMKADVWKSFPVVYELDQDGCKVHVKYFCACLRCKKVYQYKDTNGKHFGTQNQIQHLKKCTGLVQNSQMTLFQCMPKKPNLTASDSALLKHKQMLYCVSGYNSFKSVEHDGLMDLMQTCVDFGSKYGKFSIREAAVGRLTVRKGVSGAAETIRARITERLKDL